MSLTDTAILQRMLGQTLAAGERQAISTDFLSEGLDGLVNMTDEDVRDTCSSYAKRTDGVFPIILTPIQKQRMRSLVLWVKDQARVDEPLEFPNNTTAAALRAALASSLERERRRKDQKKAGESYLDSEFNIKLKSAVQWEKWYEELQATLGQIIGVRGVPLSYVIRETETPSFDPDVDYEDALEQAMTLEGVEYTQDARTVHKLITKNIAEDSDAYTYIKTLTRYRNGRRDILALRERYDSTAASQTIINKAKSELSNLRYKNERSFSFEKFSAKLQRAYDSLEEQGRPVNNGDIVDDLWARIQAPALGQYVAALKVQYQQTPRDYKLILQDIAGEAGTQTKSVTFAPGIRGISATYTRQGKTPMSGVHTPDGSIFIGSYDKDKWYSESVKQYHEEILAARNNGESTNGGGKKQSRGQKRRANAIKRSKKKLKSLKAQIAAAKSQVQEQNGDEGDDNQEADQIDDAAGSNAGNAFGGRRGRSS